MLKGTQYGDNLGYAIVCVTWTADIEWYDYHWKLHCVVSPKDVCGAGPASQ